MGKHYNQYELADYLKGKRKYMNAKQIAKDTKSSITTTLRKLNKMVGVRLETTTRKVKVGRCNHKMPVKFFRHKRK